MAESRAAETEGVAVILPDGSRIPIDAPVTIGRDERAGIRIPDRTVSRLHARITLGPSGPRIEDAGSRFGTLLSGSLVTQPTPIRPGAVIRLGDAVIHVVAEAMQNGSSAAALNTSISPQSSPGETVIVPVHATRMGLRTAAPPATDVDGAVRPRVRSGWALKRLGAEEGRECFVLRDLRTGSFVQMDPTDAALFRLIDGKQTVMELLGEAARAVGADGPGRLARLIAELADRGLLDGVSTPPIAPAAPGTIQRILKPREYSVSWLGDYFLRAYHRWGRVFFSPLGVTFLTLLALAGFGAFMYLVGARYGTPFVVANRLVIGGAVFIAGRFAVVAFHELSHGLALANYGRGATRGGLRLVLIFPYAFVDTSEAYFEPRAHRIVISAAGPASDLTLGALFSLACAASPPGSTRDVLFQLALAAYVGAFFNLNPFLDRDGYNILGDYLREPKLRQRARQQLAQRLRGTLPAGERSAVLGRYALAGVIWSVVGAVFAIIFSLRYYRPLSALAPDGLILTMFVAFYVILFIPVAAQLGLPLLRRARFGRPEVNRVIR